MSQAVNKKALYIIVNIGFSAEIAEIIRKAGAGGATIQNARGIGALHKSILGITVDTEKEVILSVVDEDVADRIIDAVREKAGQSSPASGICFTMPVDRFTKTCATCPPVL